MSLRHEYEHQELLESGQTGRAKRMRDWIDSEEKKTKKREDDRMKVLGGAALFHTSDLATVIALMDAFLTRPSERLAVLGEDGKGSEALRRCMGL